MELGGNVTAYHMLVSSAETVNKDYLVSTGYAAAARSFKHGESLSDCGLNLALPFQEQLFAFKRPCV